MPSFMLVVHCCVVGFQVYARKASVTLLQPLLWKRATAFVIVVGEVNLRTLTFAMGEVGASAIRLVLVALDTRDFREICQFE